ncbi:MAG: hypothetical protein MUD08_08390, partial [Cytophagales bacterium]|nr:hypothetical protein [Cytophagales bacterium]
VENGVTNRRQSRFQTKSPKRRAAIAKKAVSGKKPQNSGGTGTKKAVHKAGGFSGSLFRYLVFFSVIHIVW